jgi:hypothetical protein
MEITLSSFTVLVLVLPSPNVVLVVNADALLQNEIALISSIACHLSSTEPNSIMRWLKILSMACASFCH